MQKIILSLYLFLLISSFTSEGLAKAYDWSRFNGQGLDPDVRVENVSQTDWIGSAEFVDQVDFIPFDKNNRRIETLMDIQFGSAMSRSVPIGKLAFFGRRIPFRYITDSSHLNMAEVAYFKIIYRLLEHDFFHKESHFVLVAKLSPNGFVIEKEGRTRYQKEIRFRSEKNGLILNARFEIEPTNDEIQRLKDIENKLNKAIDKMEELENKPIQ